MRAVAADELSLLYCDCDTCGIARASMFKRLRIAVLLYVLLFVAAAQWLSAYRSTDWDSPLWVDVYVVDGDGHRSTREYLDALSSTEFDAIAEFFRAESRRYGVALDEPFRLRIVGRHAGALPTLAADAGPLATSWWSLRLRWLAARLRWQNEGPDGDITAFAVFHEPSAEIALDRSTALRKGLVVIANLFAAHAARGSNAVVLAHELLHTLGATDKYEPGSSQPQFPDGYAAPTQKPLLPQTQAELMAGRIPIDAQHAEIPTTLRDVVVGKTTAAEIGWTRP